MSTKTITGGFASEYDDQILWIERPEVGADAAQIVDECEYTPGKITKIVSRDDYGSEEEYGDASDELLNESTALCSGEFITMDGVFSWKSILSVTHKNMNQLIMMMWNSAK